MNRTTLITAVALVLFAATICHADSLVITYRSGKTQTVVLDEPSQGVSSWQFIGEAAPQKTGVKPPQVEQNKVQEEQAPQGTEEKQTDNTPEKKSGVHFKWNAKPIPD